jgi:hypothetical protein
MDLVETESGYIIDQETGLVFDEYGDPVIFEDGSQAQLYFDGYEWTLPPEAPEAAYEEQAATHLDPDEAEFQRMGQAFLETQAMMEAARGHKLTKNEGVALAHDMMAGRTEPSGRVLDAMNLDLDDRNQRREYMTERLRDSGEESKELDQARDWAAGVVESDAGDWEAE